VPRGWRRTGGRGQKEQLDPYSGDDMRGTSLKGANVLVPFHEVQAVRTHDNHTGSLSQVSYVAFVSQARNQATGALAHVHWFTYTFEEGDPCLCEFRKLSRTRLKREVNHYERNQISIFAWKSCLATSRCQVKELFGGMVAHLK
jgi:hypothetical protein